MSEISSGVLNCVHSLLLREHWLYICDQSSTGDKYYWVSP